MSLILPASRVALLSQFNIAELWGLRTQVGGGGSHDESVLVRREGGSSNLVSAYAFRLYIFHF